MRNPQKKPQVRRLTPERRGFCLHFGSIVFEALFPGFTLSAILPARLSAASGSRVLFLESLSSIGGVAGGGRDHLQTKALRWSLRSPFAFRGGRFFSPARRLKSYWPMNVVRNFCAPKSGPTGINARARGDERRAEQGPNRTNQPTWKTAARRKHSPMIILWARVQAAHRQGEFPSFLARGSPEALPTLHLHRAPY